MNQPSILQVCLWIVIPGVDELGGVMKEGDGCVVEIPIPDAFLGAEPYLP